MNETIHLKNSNLPKMLGDLMHSNQFLKLFSLATTLLATISMIAILVMANKAPVVIPLAQDGSALQSTALPKAEDQIEKAARRYLELRYSWEPKTVQSQIKSAKSFILAPAAKAFDGATSGIVKFSTEKLVSQKVYPDHLVVNLPEKSVSITGDRLTDIQGLRAAGPLKLTLFFESGPRTPENPWGIYIAKEKEEQ